MACALAREELAAARGLEEAVGVAPAVGHGGGDEAPPEEATGEELAHRVDLRVNARASYVLAGGGGLRGDGQSGEARARELARGRRQYAPRL